GLDVGSLRRSPGAPPARELLGECEPSGAPRRLRRGQALCGSHHDGLSSVPPCRHPDRAYLQYLWAPHATPRWPRGVELYRAGAQGRAAPHHRVFQQAHDRVSARLLVTGAAGFIGSHVCEALLARGDEVVGVDNFDPFYDRAVKERNLDALRRAKGFRFVEADIVRDALPLEGVSVVLHLAARPGVRPSLEDPASYGDTNVTGTVRVFEAV